jgi:hypothetical protein
LIARKPDPPIRSVALFTTLAGLIVLYLGIADAVPLVAFGDPNEDYKRGETLMWIATGSSRLAPLQSGGPGALSSARCSPPPGFWPS